MDRNIIIAKDLIRLARSLVAGDDIGKELEKEFSIKDVAKDPEKVLERFTELVDDKDLDRTMHKMHLAAKAARRGRLLTAAEADNHLPKPSSKHLTTQIGNDKDGGTTDKETLFNNGLNSDCFQIDEKTGVVNFTYKSVKDKFSIYEYIELLDDGTEEKIVKCDDDKMKHTVLQNLMPEEQKKVIRKIDDALRSDDWLRKRAIDFETNRLKREDDEKNSVKGKFMKFITDSINAIKKFAPPIIVLASIIYLGISIYYGKVTGNETLTTIMNALKEIAVPEKAITLVMSGLGLAGNAFKKSS